jgi:hypothetical protein
MLLSSWPPPHLPFLPCRHFWQRKGDVFHLLLNMAIVLDDRCGAIAPAAPLGGTSLSPPPFPSCCLCACSGASHATHQRSCSWNACSI